MPTVAERYNFAEVEIHVKDFISETLKICKVHQVEDIKQENALKIGTKDSIANQLARAMWLIERQNMLIVNQRVHISGYQEDIIKLQEKVIDVQNKTMHRLTSSVIDQVTEELTDQITSAVQTTVNSGFKSYSEAAQSHAASSPGPVISQEIVKTVAKQVAAEEELSKNIMVFNLPEEKNEDICEKVSEVFQHLGEKPKIEARRLGKQTKSSVRPVKVTVSSSSMAQQILAKSRNLRTSDTHKSVFLSQDRTVDQRAEQRKLVLELKKKKADTAPGWRHFIKDGQICSVESDPKKLDQ